MQSNEYIIQLARERALFSFSSLLRPVVRDAEKSIASALSLAKSLDAQRPFWTAEKFLKQDAELFQKRFEAVYRDYLDRAMQTMYRDLRMRLNDISADDLTLIDDETVNREMQVDRLLLRLKDSNDEDLSRINIIVAQLHGHMEVRERENPFRPYLIARSLHQVLMELVTAADAGRILHEHLSNALAAHLFVFYQSIRTAFESRGVRAKLLTQPGRLVKHQRYAGGSFLDGDDQLQEKSPAESGMRAIMSALPQPSAIRTAGSSAESPDAKLSAQELQDFVRKIFARTSEFEGTGIVNVAVNPAAIPAPMPSEGAELALKAASQEMLARVNQIQQHAAHAPNKLDETSRQFELFDSGRPDSAVDKMERLTIDVVGMLFQYLLEDEQIPKEARAQIGRLQIPFLKAAMMSPELLQQAEHPARKLLNRMSSVAIGIDPDTQEGKALTDEMARIADKVLHEFKDDTAVFDQCSAQLEQFLAQQLSAASKDVTPWIEQAERSTTRLSMTTISLRRFLQPLIVDARAFEFVCDIWAEVLCKEEFSCDSGAPTPFRDLLPDLLWSIQEKRNPEERTSLIRMLPGLVKRLKEGMTSIQLPQAESQQVMDHLVALHTEVLRPNRSAPLRQLFALDELRRYFLQFAVGQDCHPPQMESEGSPQRAQDAPSEPEEAPYDPTSAIEALELHATTLESALAEHGIASNLESTRIAIPAFESDEEWMAQMQLGICVERWVDAEFQVAHLNWISRNRSLFLFRDKSSDRPFVYSAHSLLKALREGSVRQIEYAPAFERAVDAFICDADSLTNAPIAPPTNTPSQPHI